MKTAIISDIHGNLEALLAVLEDIEDQGIKRILCLGDIVGYGPNPLECLAMLDRFRVCLLGNHERALVNGTGRFNVRARRALEWTSQTLQSSPEGAALLARAAALSPWYEEDGVLYVHASPRDPLNEYLMPSAARDQARLALQFERFQHYCFVGHTHVPGVLERDKAFEHPKDMLMNIFMLAEGEKAIVNVGSVGQPRDHDPRACYVVFDGDAVVYRRVTYDVQTTVNKIRGILMLDNFLGDRLLEGK
jgi:diadenosine tetraphosphatase ApaH/serine/threonine PP2A family protein phosphatase